MKIFETGWLMKPPEDFDQMFEACLNSKLDICSEIAFLANTNIPETKLHKLGKLIKSLAEYSSKSKHLLKFKELRLAIISNANIDLLELPMVGAACRYHIKLDVLPISLSKGVNDLLLKNSEQGKSIDYALILFDYRAYIENSVCVIKEVNQWVDLVVEDISQMIEILEEKYKCVPILANFVDPPESPFGNYDLRVKESLRSAVYLINHKLLEKIPEKILYLDLNRFASKVGLNNWYDKKQWHHGKIPFSPKVFPAFIDQVLRLISSNMGKSKKCLVLDFDNTLWGGVIGDDGIDGIELGNGSPRGEAFLEFHRYILTLRSRGILIAGCSKNNLNTALDMLNKHPETLIKEIHFSSIICNWDDKVKNIKLISSELNIGLDSLVFFDDNPFERDLVRKYLPEVAVVEVPSDPALFTSVLDDSGYFEPVGYSDEDKTRNDFYKINKKRAAISPDIDLAVHLAGLGMILEIDNFNSMNRTRVTQLINKTNQFNLTTKRYTQSQVEQIELSKEHYGFCFRLKDNFGDNGIISVVICHAINEYDVFIDTFLMSCRVFNRTVEQAILNFIAGYMKNKNFLKLYAEYVASEKNHIVKNLYLEYGFLNGNHDGTWSLDLKSYEESKTHVELVFLQK